MAHEPDHFDFSNLAGTSTSGFGAGFSYGDRRVNGVNPAFTPEQITEISSGIRSSRAGQPADVYSGSFLVDENGFINRAAYDLKQDQYDELFSLSDTQRKLYLNVLAGSGYYGSSKPSQTGTLDKDRAAFQELLVYANSRGRTWRGLIGEMVANPQASVTAGNKFRVTPSQDLAKSLDMSSWEVLGRRLTPQERSAAADSIQSRERSGDRTSLSTMVGAAVGKADPSGARATAAAGYMDIMDRRIKSWGG